MSTPVKRIPITMPPPLSKTTAGERSDVAISSTGVPAAISEESETVEIPPVENPTLSPVPPIEPPAITHPASNTLNTEATETSVSLSPEHTNRGRGFAIYLALFGILFGISGLIFGWMGYSSVNQQPATERQAASAHPSADFTLLRDEDSPFTSPDGELQVQQYYKESDQVRLYRFWILHKTSGVYSPLNPGETGIEAEYAAGFRFTPDSRSLVRMQKAGSGEQTLFLYKRVNKNFVPATSKPLGDLAWEYFYSLPESKDVPTPAFHLQALLIRGLETNYAWLNQNWPDSRYVVISLRGEISDGGQHSVIKGWRCVYDLQSGEFSVPAIFYEDNRTALAQEPKKAVRKELGEPERREILELANTYVMVGNQNNLDAATSVYASAVDYLDRGILSLEEIREDIGAYQKRWPQREYQLLAPAEIIFEPETPDNPPDSVWVRLNLSFKVSNGSKTISGSSTVVIGTNSDTKPLRISSIRETIERRKR